MGRQVKLKVPDQRGIVAERDCELLDIMGSKDQWSEYTLEDGAQIRMKQAIVQVVKIIGEKGPEGDPVYTIQAQPIISVIPPQKKSDE